MDETNEKREPTYEEVEAMRRRAIAACLKRAEAEASEPLGIDTRVLTYAQAAETLGRVTLSGF